MNWVVAKCGITQISNWIHHRKSYLSAHFTKKDLPSTVMIDTFYTCINSFE